MAWFPPKSCKHVRAQLCHYTETCGRQLDKEFSSMHQCKVKDVVDVAPLLLPADPKMLSYAGFITVGKQSFYLKIILPENGILKDARIECEWKLQHMLRGYESVIKKRLQQSQDLPSFLLELKSVLDQIQRCSNTSIFNTSPSFYVEIIKDIETIGWNRILHVDQYFRNFKITARDKADREHVLSIHIPERFPLVAPVCNAQLPTPFQPSWSSSITLCDIVKQFEDELDGYQEFWDVVTELDIKTWILEPENPSYSCVYRRIVIGNNVSIHVTLDPFKPKLLPECRFLGPEYAVIPLKEMYSKQQDSWNELSSLLKNLEYLLGIEFPSPNTTKKEEFSSECGVCYTLRHFESNSTPDITCDNIQCGQTYHHACLHEWLKSLSTTRENFAMLSGECPYCSSGIIISAVIR